MLRSVLLLLPVLLPSWRFFQRVEASPRIEYRAAGSERDAWRPYRPRPQHVSVATMLRRLFWNPTWNDSLFLVSLAERILDDGRDHAIREIFERLRADHPELAGDPLQFRLLVIHREGRRVEAEVAYTSPIDGPAPAELAAA
jgi:hypothetical protein